MKFLNVNKSLLMFFAGLAAVFFSGCHSFQNNYRTLQQLAEHFHRSGIKIEAIQELHPYFQSEKAMSLQISGLQIGIYKFNTVMEPQKERLKKIADCKYVFVEGMKFPVIVNGTFMLLGYEKNPQKKKIIEAFESF